MMLQLSCTVYIRIVHKDMYMYVYSVTLVLYTVTMLNFLLFSMALVDMIYLDNDEIINYLNVYI